ncbi:MAG: hypothetical protein ABH874_02675 [Methanobacteriota archaeon]
MGSHTWAEQCTYCGFEEMIVSTYDSFYFEAACPICGYARWTEEKMPDNHDIELAKQALGKMDDKEKQKLVELYEDDCIPLVARQKRKF